MSRPEEAPEDLGIPVGSWRPGQWELVAKIVSWFDSGAEVVALEAPPGVGKSIIAVAVARLLGEKALVLTGTKQLQEQYSSSFPGIVDIRGRSNYPCIAYTGETCDAGACVAGEPCEYQYGEGRNPSSILCHYYRAKAVAKVSPLVVANYAYYLADNGAYPGPLMTGTRLFVLDEAHTIEDQIRGWLRVEISQKARAALGVSTTKEDDIDWLEMLSSRAQKWLQEHKHWLAGDGWANLSKAEHRLFLSVSRLRSALGPLIEDLRENSISWVPEKFGEALAFKPVTVSKQARAMLLPPGKRVLLMSATLSETMLAEIGLGAGDYTRLSVPSPFPIEHRPVVFLPVARVNHTMGTQEEQALVQTVDKILDHHAKSKGLIHTTNYKIARLLVMDSRHQMRLVAHDQKNRAEVLARFKASPRPLVLVSPSMTTGVDLPYEQCRFQIVAKVGWPDRGDLQVSFRSQLFGGDAWYVSRAIQNLVQAYGRGVRAEDDRCVFYVLDETFRGLLGGWRGLIPDWFLEALRVGKTPA